MIATVVPTSVAHTNVAEAGARTSRSKSRSRSRSKSQSNSRLSSQGAVLQSFKKSTSVNSAIKTQQQYLQFIADLKQANNQEETEDKKRIQNLKRTWMLLTVDGRNYYVSRKEPTLKHVYLEEVFDIIHTENAAIGHYGRDKIQKELRKKIWKHNRQYNQHIQQVLYWVCKEEDEEEEYDSQFTFETFKKY